MSNAAVELIQTITLAFANVASPSIDDLVHNNEPEHSECVEIKERLKGKNWKDMGEIIKEKHYPGDDIHFLTADALKALIPGYMVGTIQNFRNADLVPEALITRLAPNHNDPSGEEASNLIGKLSPEQREAVLQFLMYLRSNHAEDIENDELDSAIHFLSSY